MQSQHRVRSVGLDALRLFGFIAIVVGHAVPTDAVRDAVFPWHVALFFFLTGYLWTPEREVRAEVSKRWRSLLRPYFAWLVVIGVPLLVFDFATRELSDVVRRAGTVVLGGTYLKSPFQAFWFLCALAVCALVYRGVERALGTRAAPMVALPVLGLTLTAPLGDWIAAVPYSLGVGVMATFFVASGDLFRRYRLHLGGPAVLMLLASVALVALDWVRPMDMKAGDWGSPAAGFLIGAGISAGLVVLFELGFRDRGPAWITSAASLGLVLVLAHGVPIHLIEFRWPWWAVIACSLSFAVLAAFLVRNSPLLTGRPLRNSVPVGDVAGNGATGREQRRS